MSAAFAVDHEVPGAAVQWLGIDLDQGADADAVAADELSAIEWRRRTPLSVLAERRRQRALAHAFDHELELIFGR